MLSPRRWIEGRAATLLAIAVSLVLLSPSLGAGYLLDDFSFQMILSPDARAAGLGRADWDLFRFEDGSPAHFAAALRRGLWPWWVAPDFRLAFFRPLSSWMHAWEFRHLPAWAQHLHSLAWYAALVGVVGALHRRLLGAGWVAGVATLLFAIDDAHALPVVWISHRNALIALTFGLAALLAHDRAVRPGEGERPGHPAIASALFAIALCAGEAAFGALAWIVAHALALDPRPRSARAKSLAPYALVAIVWFALYRGMGYGAAGGGFYIDPLRQPGAFALALLTRAPLLLISLIALPPADLWMDQPPRTQLIAAGVAYVLLALIARWLRGALRGDPLTPFFVTGIALSLVPVCATWPSDRLLLAAGVGGFALIARVLASPAASRALRVAVIVTHGLIAPALLTLKCFAMPHMFGGMVRRAAESLPFDARAPELQLAVLTAPDLLAPLYALSTRVVASGRMPPGELHTLAVHVEGALSVHRVDARTLDLTLSEGFLHDSLSQTMRGAPWRFRVGESVQAGWLRATPLSLTADGRPRRVRFTFDRSLDDPALRWIRWEVHRFVAWSPPPVGASISLRPIDMRRALAGP